MTKPGPAGEPPFNVMTCGAAEAAKARVLHNVPVWRYHLANNKPGSTKGASLTSDVRAIWGEGTTGISKIFQDAWVAFVKDPDNGLSKIGWPKYEGKGNTLVRIAHDGKLVADFPLATTYDGLCEMHL